MDEAKISMVAGMLSRASGEVHFERMFKFYEKHLSAAEMTLVMLKMEQLKEDQEWLSNPGQRTRQQKDLFDKFLFDETRLDHKGRWRR